MKNTKTLEDNSDVILFYKIKDNNIAVVAGNRTVYEGKIHWLIRGDYSNFAEYWDLFEKEPIGWDYLGEIK